MSVGGPARITFAIPYYSRPDLLALALDSVLAQTTPDWRLVVSDDSPDGSGEPAVRAVADPRVRYVRADRPLGMAGNWNRGLDAADTDLVTLLHADDQLRPGYAAVMLAAAARHPAAVGLFCRADVIGPTGRPAFSVPDRVKGWLAPTHRELALAGPAGVARLLRGNFVMCPTVCYRRSKLGGRRFDGRWKFVTDLDLFTRLLADGDELVGLPDRAYAYRRHPGNATAGMTDSLVRFDEEARLYERWAAAGAARGWWQVAATGRRKSILYLHLAFRVGQEAVAGRLGTAAAKARHGLRLLGRPLTPERPCTP